MVESGLRTVEFIDFVPLLRSPDDVIPETSYSVPASLVALHALRLTNGYA